MYLSRSQRPVIASGQASHAGESADAEERRIVALLLGRVSCARLKDVVPPRSALLFVTTVADLKREVLAARRGTTIVCEPRDGSGAPTGPVIRVLLAKAPALAVIGYAPKGSSSSELLDLANAGIDELVQEGIDDAGIALRRAYRGSIEACAARAVMGAVGSEVPALLHPMMQYCLRYPRDDHSVAGLAASLAVDRKTLLNYTRRHGTVPPSVFSTWCRLLLAAALLELTGETAEGVSDALEFPSPSAFRNVCRRYAGQRPSEWRQPGGLERVAEEFKRKLRPRAASAVAS